MRGPRQHGYIMLPVVILLTLVATVAFTINYESALDTGITASSLQAEQAEKLAQAGLAHASWAVENSGCIGDLSMSSVPLGPNSYSLTVDSAATTTEYIINPDIDAVIDEANPTVNDGNSSELVVKENSTSSSLRSLLHFDLSAIPAGERVSSATAWFYVTVNNAASPVNIHRVTAFWTEPSASWDSIAASVDNTVFGVIPQQTGTGVWVPVNITALVQLWINDSSTNFGLVLIGVPDNMTTQFSSSEFGTASLRPYLQITTADSDVSPVQISATGTLTGNPSPANDLKRTFTRTAARVYQTASGFLLQPGSADGEDAWLTADKTTWNYGSFALLRARAGGGGHWRSPIRFELGSLPHGAHIASATLELYRISGTQDAPGVIDVHAITRSWEEGSSSGGTAPGVTWDFWDNPQPWSTPGGDFDAAPSARIEVDASTDTWFSIDVTSVVQQWVDGSRQNHGLMLVPGDDNVRAEFSSSDESDPAVRPKLTIRYACECGSPCLAPRGSGTVLMVVINPTTLVPVDAYKKALLESWGYTVAIVGESANQASYDAAIANADVVFISETVNSIQVGTRLQDAAIGVVSQDGSYNNALGFASGSAIAVAAAINVTDPGHYITAVLPAGVLQIYSEPMEQLTVSGSPAPGLQVLADTGGSGSLAVLETGAMGTGGTPLAGRRVMLPLGRESGFNWDYLNGNGRLLLHRSLQWAMGADLDATPPKRLLFVSDSTSPGTEDQQRINWIESWGYVVSLIADDDTPANFDAAAASNDVAYVSSTTSASVLSTKLASAGIGVVNEQAGLVEEFGFAQANINYKSRSQIDVIDNGHFITQTFTTGMLTIFTADQSLHIMTSNKAPDLVALGRVFNTGSLWDDSLAAIEAGGQLYGGGNAAGRRVLLPWGDASFDPGMLNADGQTIMQRAIDWASSPPPAKPPLAHWKLDETGGPVAADAVGGHDGTWVNNPVPAAGHVDGALAFDGSNDYVNVPHDDALSLADNMTFAAWISAAAYGAGYQAILAKDAGAAASNYWFGTWQQELVFGFFASGVFREVFTTGLALQPGTWYHVAASFDDGGDTVRLYVDGSEVHSGTLTFSPAAVGADLTIGRSPLGQYWPGLLDDVRIYDEVLVASEIATIASGAGSGPDPGACDGSYRDEFEAGAFNNSDGSIDWSNSPWQEIGESDGPGAGDIQVLADLAGNRIRTRDNDNGGEGLEREADLTGATTASLSYDYRRNNLDDSNDYSTVEISANGAGGPWIELARYQGAATDAAYTPATHNISAFIGANTRIRFKTSPDMGLQDIVWFDNIQILCAP